MIYRCIIHTYSCLFIAMWWYVVIVHVWLNLDGHKVTQFTQARCIEVMSAFLWMHLEKRQKSFFWQAEIGSISLGSLFLKSRTNLPFSSLGFMIYHLILLISIAKMIVLSTHILRFPLYGACFRIGLSNVRSFIRLCCISDAFPVIFF